MVSGRHGAGGRRVFHKRRVPTSTGAYRRLATLWGAAPTVHRGSGSGGSGRSIVDLDPVNPGRGHRRRFIRNPPPFHPARRSRHRRRFIRESPPFHHGKAGPQAAFGAGLSTGRPGPIAHAAWPSRRLNRRPRPSGARRPAALPKDVSSSERSRSDSRQSPRRLALDGRFWRPCA
jgi:hypothetical protein